MLLDEPMTGLDPIGRRRGEAASSSDLHGEGKTVLFNSHILADVAELCTRIAIMRAGVVLWTGTVTRRSSGRRRPRGLLHADVVAQA